MSQTFPEKLRIIVLLFRDKRRLNMVFLSHEFIPLQLLANFHFTLHLHIAFDGIEQLSPAHKILIRNLTIVLILILSDLIVLLLVILLSQIDGDTKALLGHLCHGVRTLLFCLPLLVDELIVDCTMAIVNVIA